jgi:hypothetical protein
VVSPACVVITPGRDAYLQSGAHLALSLRDSLSGAREQERENNAGGGCSMGARPPLSLNHRSPINPRETRCARVCCQNKMTNSSLERESGWLAGWLHGRRFLLAGAVSGTLSITCIPETVYYVSDRRGCIAAVWCEKK